jgi:hypothetical protein
MKPRRLGYGYGYSYGRGRRAAAALLLLLLCLCLSSALLILLHGSSAPLEEKAAAAAAGARVVEAAAEVEEAPLPPGNTKVAFLFIARNRLPLELVWDAFFRVRTQILPHYLLLKFVIVSVTNVHPSLSNATQCPCAS